MSDTFQKALAFVLSWEGKLSNDPDDAGGLTYRGITMRDHPDWEGWPFVHAAQFDKADEFVSDFYFNNYWTPAGCGSLNPDMAFIVFDTAVNMGIQRTRRILLESSDWQDFLFNRIDSYSSIAKLGNNIQFLRGWINRTIALYKTVKRGD